MSVEDRFALPATLPALVERYEGKNPSAVRFRLPSWETALTGTSGHPTRLLSDPTLTTEPSDAHYCDLGDRMVTRDAVTAACASVGLADDDAVLAAFVLVMAWGSGTSNSRSLRNTGKALQNRAAAAAVLRESSVMLRKAEDITDPMVADAYRAFALPGVGEAFFTKWFAFAGVTAGRSWQPLILDSRVRSTLNTTLDVWLNQLAGVRQDPSRYIAYLTALHRWAEQLPQPMTADRLEWIMFDHNGKRV